MRWLLAVGALCLTALIAQITFGLGFARAYPYLNADTKSYLELQVSERLLARQDLLLAALRDVTGIDADAISQALLAAQVAEAPTLIITDGALIIANSAHTVDSSFLPAGWRMSVRFHGGRRYSIMTREANEPLTTRLSWTWWSPWRMHQLAQQYDAVMLGDRFYAVLSAQNEYWQVLIARKARELRYPVLRQESVVANQASLTIMTEPPRLLPINEFWRALLQSPATVDIRRGALADLSNPYSNELAWAAELQANVESANQLLKNILSELTARFPMAVERVLPDRSQVYELKRNESFFLTAEQVVDVAVEPAAAFTFPRDQIRYTYGDGRLRLQKGEATDSEGRPAINNCVLPDSIFAGNMTGDFLSTNMWTNLFFGLNQQMLAICVDKPSK